MNPIPLNSPSKAAGSVYDYLPVVSSLTNLPLLVKRAFSTPPKESAPGEKVYEPITDKSLLRMMLLIFAPGIGNLAVGLYDIVNYLKTPAKEEPPAKQPDHSVQKPNVESLGIYACWAFYPQTGSSQDEPSWVGC